MSARAYSRILLSGRGGFLALPCSSRTMMAPFSMYSITTHTSYVLEESLMATIEREREIEWIRTQIQFIVFWVVDYFMQSDQVGMIELLHDSNLAHQFVMTVLANSAEVMARANFHSLEAQRWHKREREREHKEQCSSICSTVKRDHSMI